MHKTLLLTFVVAACGLAQPIGIGVKGGVPFTDLFDSESPAAATDSKRYLIGARGCSALREPGPASASVPIEKPKKDAPLRPSRHPGIVVYHPARRVRRGTARRHPWLRRQRGGPFRERRGRDRWERPPELPARAHELWHPVRRRDHGSDALRSVRHGVRRRRPVPPAAGR